MLPLWSAVHFDNFSEFFLNAGLDKNEPKILGSEICRKNFSAETEIHKMDTR
jgi:hypothetical protein